MSRCKKKLKTLNTYTCLLSKVTAPVTGNPWVDFWASVRSWTQNLFNIKPAQNITGTSYIYDNSGNLLAEYDASNSNKHMEYVWLPTPSGIAIPLALIKNQHAFAIYSDHLHTPRIVTNAQQEIVWRWDYSGFGEIAAQATAIKQTTNPTNQAPKSLQVNLRYPGQYFDVESGLHYNWHRSYDQHTGRYTQADPIGLNGGWNRFGYANANALGFVDPEGLDAATISDIGRIGLPSVAGICASTGGTACAAAAVGAAGVGSYVITDRFVNPWLQPLLQPLLTKAIDACTSSSSSQREECEKSCDAEYDRGRDFCRAMSGMRGRDKRTFQQCMAQVDAQYVACYQGC